MSFNLQWSIYLLTILCENMICVPVCVFEVYYRVVKLRSTNTSARCIHSYFRSTSTVQDSIAAIENQLQATPGWQENAQSHETTFLSEKFLGNGENLTRSLMVTFFISPVFLSSLCFSCWFLCLVSSLGFRSLVLTAIYNQQKLWCWI